MAERIPDEFIQRVESSISIVSLFEKYTEIKRAGSDYVCLCPFHSEKTASCHIYAEEEHFYCFGCGAGGDVINFVRLMENAEYAEAVKVLAETAGLAMPETGEGEYRTGVEKARVLEMNRTAARFWAEEFVRNETPRVYMSNRGIKAETVRKYGIGWAENSWDRLKEHMKSKGYGEEELYEGSLVSKNAEKGNFYDKFRGRVMFPIVDNKRNVTGFGGRTVLPGGEPKYLNSSETAAFRKGNGLFSLNFAKDSDSESLILCEGYMDAVALNQAGYGNAVATLGTAITEAQARLMKRFKDKVIISYDSDAAGKKAAFKAVNLLTKAGVKAKVLRIEGAKDPDEYINKYGKESFGDMLEKADGVWSFSINELKTGLDLTTQEGRAEYIRKSAEVIAEIENLTERNIYISDTAKMREFPQIQLKMRLKTE